MKVRSFVGNGIPFATKCIVAENLPKMVNSNSAKNQKQKGKYYV